MDADEVYLQDCFLDKAAVIASSVMSCPGTRALLPLSSLAPRSTWAMVT